MRLNRYIASCTHYSRRQADQLIAERRVTVQEIIVVDFSYQVAAGDIVKIDGAVIAPARLVYYIVHKPMGYVSTTKKTQAKKIVTDLVPSMPPVFPVGRLDKDSRGLMILTNDGTVAHELMHPKFLHQKEYDVTYTAPITDKQINAMQTGIALTEGLAKADAIKRVTAHRIQITLHQGYNRQLRRMAAAVGNEVQDLCRIRIGGIQLGGLPPGKYVSLNGSLFRKKVFSTQT